MYPDPRVAGFINDHFVPVKIHIKEQPDMWRRFGIRWTPTILVIDPSGREQRRIEGFLPADELLGQLELALGYAAASRKDWAEAERIFHDVTERFPDSEAAPEGQYWEGVSRYSASHDAAELRAIARSFQQRYSNTNWAKRASVWSAE